MYLYIFEDGEIKQSTTFANTDAECCDAGILDVINISGDIPKQYYAGEWHALDSADANDN